MPKYRLYSNSSLSDFNMCPRLFYFRYILEWSSEGNSLPLIFGSCWHRSMDVVWTDLLANKPIDEVLSNSYQAFLNEWLALGMTHPSELGMEGLKELGARNPMNAQEMLIGYISNRARFIRSGEVELLQTEKPFAIPLDPDEKDLFYVGKIDKVIKHVPYHKIRGMEHKSTTAYKKSNSRGLGSRFKSSFLDSFSPNSQVDGYLYALHMYYPGQVGGVWIDGALVHKDEQDFVLIPIEHQMQMLELWLWETRSTIDEIDANLEAARNTDPKSPYMAAFRRDTRSCYSMYGAACPYLIPCKSFPNPTGKPIPKGFKHKPWDPLEHIKMKEEDLDGKD